MNPVHLHLPTTFQIEPRRTLHPTPNRPQADASHKTRDRQSLLSSLSSSLIKLQPISSGPPAHLSTGSRWAETKLRPTSTTRRGDLQFNSIRELRPSSRAHARAHTHDVLPHILTLHLPLQPLHLHLAIQLPNIPVLDPLALLATDINIHVARLPGRRIRTLHLPDPAPLLAIASRHDSQAAAADAAESVARATAPARAVLVVVYHDLLPVGGGGFHGVEGVWEA